MLWDNKPLNALVENIYDQLVDILRLIGEKASDIKVMREIIRVRELTQATREKFDPDQEYDEISYIIRFLDILEYAIHTKEKWES